MSELLRKIQRKDVSLMRYDLIWQVRKYTFPSPSVLYADHCQQLDLDTIPTYSNSVVVGRFQPFHYGHLYLIKYALSHSQTVSIVVGSANIINNDNPFTARERQLMILYALKKERLLPRIRIVYLNDYNSDTVWLDTLLKEVKELDAVYGNNIWVNGLFNKINIPTYEVPFLNRDSFQGQVIRERLRADGIL